MKNTNGNECIVITDCCHKIFQTRGNYESIINNLGNMFLTYNEKDKTIKCNECNECLLKDDHTMKEQ